MEDLIDVLSFAKNDIFIPVKPDVKPYMPVYNQFVDILVYDGAILEFELDFSRLLNINVSDKEISLTYMYEESLPAFLKELSSRMSSYYKKLDIVLLKENGKKLFIESEATYNGNFEIQFGSKEHYHYNYHEITIKFNVKNVAFYTEGIPRNIDLEYLQEA